MAGGIISMQGKKEDPRPIAEEQERDQLGEMIKKIEQAPIQTFGREQFAEDELRCLTDNVYHEARGEGPKGRYAVIFSTLGRVLDKKYPKSICGVVHQPWQFSWTADNTILSQPINPRDYLKVAIEVHNLMQGRDVRSASVAAGLQSGLPHGAIYYKVSNFTGSTQVEKFFSRLQRVATIGNHDFFVEKAARAHVNKKRAAPQSKTALSPAPLQQRRTDRVGKNREG